MVPNERRLNMIVNPCVMCGEETPEGRMVCGLCENLEAGTTKNGIMIIDFRGEKWLCGIDLARGGKSNDEQAAEKESV